MLKPKSISNAKTWQELEEYEKNLFLTNKEKNMPIRPIITGVNKSSLLSPPLSTPPSHLQSNNLNSFISIDDETN